MNLLDKAIASMTPTPSDQDMQEARAKARAAAGDTGWLAMIIGHHEQIESAFAAVKDAGSASARQTAQKHLALILTGHSIAEESVIYPAMALGNQERHADERKRASIFPKLRESVDPVTQGKLTRKYQEEYDRYVAAGA